MVIIKQTKGGSRIICQGGEDLWSTGVIPISLFLLATGTVLCKAAIDRGVRLSTGRYGCRQLKKNIKFDGKCANLVCVSTFWVFKPFL